MEGEDGKREDWKGKRREGDIKWRWMIILQCQKGSTPLPLCNCIFATTWVMCSLNKIRLQTNYFFQNDSPHQSDTHSAKLADCWSTQSLCHTISPNVGVGVWFSGTESESESHQWRREGVCRPGQTSLLPPPPPQSDLQLIFLWLQRWH